MGIFSFGSKTDDGQKDEAPAKSVFFSNQRIDKQGRSWKKKSFWIRQEHLGKLKVMAHFKGKDIQVLLDRALKEYIAREYDESAAMKKMVTGADQKKREKVPG